MVRERQSAARTLLGVLLASAGLCACPPPVTPPGDAGLPCSNDRECNPDGRVCGQVSRCIVGHCTPMPVVLVCAEGGSEQDGARPGECLGWEDCNPANACGEVISCVNYLCDRTGPRLEIPCSFDAGTATDR